MIMTSEQVVMHQETKKQIIRIPEFSTIDQQFYLDDKILDNELEEDSDLLYNQLHKAYELAEIFSKLMPDGEVLPTNMKQDLKVRIQMPTSNNNLPEFIV
jgi:hypothetical protein